MKLGAIWQEPTRHELLFLIKNGKVLRTPRGAPEDADILVRQERLRRSRSPDLSVRKLTSRSMRTINSLFRGW